MKKSESKSRYRWLKLPLATPAEAEERRAYLISIGTIRPEEKADEQSTVAGGGQ